MSKKRARKQVQETKDSEREALFNHLRADLQAGRIQIPEPGLSWVAELGRVDPWRDKHAGEPSLSRVFHLSADVLGNDMLLHANQSYWVGVGVSEPRPILSASLAALEMRTAFLDERQIRNNSAEIQERLHLTLQQAIEHILITGDQEDGQPVVMDDSAMLLLEILAELEEELEGYPMFTGRSLQADQAYDDLRQVITPRYQRDLVDQVVHLYRFPDEIVAREYDWHLTLPTVIARAARVVSIFREEGLNLRERWFAASLVSHYRREIERRAQQKKSNDQMMSRGLWRMSFGRPLGLPAAGSSYLVSIS